MAGVMEALFGRRVACIKHCFLIPILKEEIVVYVSMIPP